MNNPMNNHMKNLVVVEGPTGAGKSTYIDMVFDNNRGILTVDSNFQQVSKGRFTFDDCSHQKAIENDTLKLKKAFSFLQLADTDTVMIDRLFFSDWVYEHIRNYGRSIKNILRVHKINPAVLLNRFALFVAQQARELEFTDPYRLELILVCPDSYSLLADRRATNPDKAYPFAHLDWYVYHQFILAINQHVSRKNTRVSAIYQFDDVLVTLIND